MEERPAPLIRLEKVSIVRYGKTILRDLDWQICAGQHWAILGPNGSGKSLLMQVVQGNLPCSAGRVIYTDPTLPARMAQVSLEQHQRLIAHEQDQAIYRQFGNSGEEGTTSGSTWKPRQRSKPGAPSPTSFTPSVWNRSWIPPCWRWSNRRRCCWMSPARDWMPKTANSSTGRSPR